MQLDDVADVDVAELGGEPSRSRVLRRRGRETVARLLRAGQEVVEERGHDNARVDDIVARAEVSHGTFYLYFRDREDLLSSLVRLAGESLRPLAATLPDDGDPVALAAWFERAELVLDEHVEVLRAAESLRDHGALTVLVGPLAHALRAAGGRDEDLVARMVVEHFARAVVRADVIDGAGLATIALRAAAVAPQRAVVGFGATSGGPTGALGRVAATAAASA